MNPSCLHHPDLEALKILKYIDSCGRYLENCCYSFYYADDLLEEIKQFIINVSNKKIAEHNDCLEFNSPVITPSTSEIGVLHIVAEMIDSVIRDNPRPRSYRGRRPNLKLHAIAEFLKKWSERISEKYPEYHFDVIHDDIFSEFLTEYDPHSDPDFRAVIFGPQ